MSLISKPLWTEGQLVRPQHFQQQDLYHEALLDERIAALTPYRWGVAAVDPRVIPLGTHLTIPGYGEGVAADTGGAVRGATVDLWFPTLAQARGWGRRTVTITLH